MELAEVLRIIWSRKLLSALIVLLAAGAAVGAGTLAHSTPTGSATVQILVDSPQSALADLQQNTFPLTTRASLFAQVMASETVLEQHRHGIRRARRRADRAGSVRRRGTVPGRDHPLGSARQPAARRARRLPLELRGAERRAGRDRLGAGPHGARRRARRRRDRPRRAGLRRGAGARVAHRAHPARDDPRAGSRLRPAPSTPDRASR